MTLNLGRLAARQLPEGHAFRWNQFLYDMTSMVTDIVFDVVGGKALMKAAKLLEIVKKSKE